MGLGQMMLMRKIKAWHEKDEHQKIIDEIEKLPEKDLTPELICLLARAYNNLGTVSGDKACFIKAAQLLYDTEDALKDTFEWNYRNGYAAYYLGCEYAALGYFEKALELAPKDKDTETFVNTCRDKLSYPLFNASFRQRVTEVWEHFCDCEAELRETLDNKQHNEELIDNVRKLLKPALYEPIFEIGGGNGTYELILSPNGVRVWLFPLVYFRDHAPAEVLAHWNILIGRRSIEQKYELRMFDMDEGITAEDVTVWLEKQDNRAFLAFYSPKLVPLLPDGKALSVMSILLDQVIGELTAIALVADINVLPEPKDGEGIPMTALYGKLCEEFELLQDGTLTAEQLCDSYSGYEMQPDTVSNEPRKDVYFGVTSCYRLLGEYYNDDTTLMDEFHDSGIAAGYFFYPHDCIEEQENRGAAVLDFRESIEAAILEKAGADAVHFIGGATGICNSYIDFLAWDSEALFDAAREVFEQSPVSRAGLQVFRPNTDAILIHNA